MFAAGVVQPYRMASGVARTNTPDIGLLLGGREQGRRQPEADAGRHVRRTVVPVRNQHICSRHGERRRAGSHWCRDNDIRTRRFRSAPGGDRVRFVR